MAFFFREDRTLALSAEHVPHMAVALFLRSELGALSAAFPRENRSLLFHCLHLSLTRCYHIAAQPRATVVTAASRASVTVEAKQNSLKRERVTLRNRSYNKSRKSEISTRMKKVFVALDAAKGNITSENDLADVQVLINEAYQCIDKATVKGVLHANTAARRKARLAKARKIVLVEAGLYTPN